MKRSELKELNASFGDIMNFNASGFSSYAVLPFGGAYVLDNGTYVHIAHTNDIYDIQELRSFLFDAAKAVNA